MTPFDVATLQPGDTLLYRPPAFSCRRIIGWLIGRAIARKTWRSISHVEIYIGQGQSVASRDGVGVGAYPLRLDGLGYVLRPFLAPGETFDMHFALWWFETVKGQKYDWLGLLRFVRTGSAARQVKTRQFCSPFWLRFMRRCLVAPTLRPFQPFSPRIDADTLCPGEIVDSPDEYVVWTDGRDPDYTESGCVPPAPAFAG